MSDFSNYELEILKISNLGVYGLADELLPEMADTLGHELASEPSSEDISDFIGRFGPDKELQQNISLVKDVVNLDTAADWVERSGLLVPAERAFRDNTELDLDKIDRVVMTGGVANWMLRRTAIIERLGIDDGIEVDIVTGNREMKPQEHKIVSVLSDERGIVTESDFAYHYLRERLMLAGVDADVIEADTSNGDEVIAELFSGGNELIAEEKILVVGNAPSYVQTAGQFRKVARQFNSDFDSGEEPQLFMVSDTIPVARKGESTATHQNPYSALGQIARNALFINQAVQELE